MKLRNWFMLLVCVLAFGVLGDTHAAAADGYLSYDEAVVAVRGGLKARQEVITVQVKSETELFMADCNALYDQAIAHTGVPTEGDYILSNTAGNTRQMKETVQNGVYYYTFTYTPVWLSTAAQEKEVDAAVQSILDELNLWNADEYEKVVGVYDWITEYVQYDFDNEDDDSNLSKHSTYSAVITRRTVCQGYASLLYRMLLTLDVDCRVVIGTAGGEKHGWNIVKLGDWYYNCDPTWDRDLKGHYRYFLCTDASFATHTRLSPYKDPEFRGQYPMSELPYIRNVAASGTVNGQISWVLDGDTGTLTVTGTGAIPSYRFSEPPWYPYRNSVQHIVVEEGITEIGERALYWCVNCTSVDLPDSLVAIREYGFNNLRALESITLPPNLKTLEFCAFSECAALRSIVLPDSVTEVGTSVFSNCMGLRSATLSAGMTTIPSSMFFNCKKLSGITIPEGITYIDDTAFHSTNLRYVRLPTTLTGMGSSVFAGCTWMEEYIVEEGNPTFKVVDGVLFSMDGKTLISYPAGKSGMYTVPEGTEYIADSAFRSVKSMGKITFCSTLKEIGDYAFSYCNSIHEVTFPKNITKIGDSAFRSCMTLYDVTFLNDSVELDSAVFAECDNLVNITLPAKLKAVPGYLFFGCGRLESITIPKTAASIGPSAFLDCDYLTSITIPGNVKSIGRQAFDYCNRLRTITLEEGVERLENLSIRNAPALTMVTIPDSLTYIDPECFEECPQLVLYGSCGSYGYRYAQSKGLSFNASHPYTASEVYEPTCTAQGYTRYRCGCGSYWYNGNFVSAYGHDYMSWVTAKAATCTEQGMESRMCTRCGVEETRYTNMLPHTGGAVVKENTVAPKCEAVGTYEDVVYCTVCKTEISRTMHTVSALGHTDKDKNYTCDVCKADLCTDHKPVTVKGRDADCVNGGLTDGSKCSVCGDILTEQKPIPAKGHAETAVPAVTPTCTDTGLTEGKRCSRCGKTLAARETVPPKGHTEVIDEAEEATCTEAGLTEGKHCSDCGIILTAQTTVPPKGHTEVKDDAVAATCTEAGRTEGKHCGVCKAVLTPQTVLPPNGHSYGAWKLHQAPTCTEQGAELRTCKHCDAFEQRKVAAAEHAGKDAVREHEVKATCTAAGSYEDVVYCTSCGTYEISRVKHTIAALGHRDWNKDYICDSCGADLCTAHQISTLKGYAATCTTDGLTDGAECAKCGEILTLQTVIPAKGHTSVADEAVAATCTDTGLTEGKHCSVCGTVLLKQEIVPAKGHTEVADKAVSPTCTAPGKTQGKHCSVCNTVIMAQEPVPPLGHSYGSWMVTAKASCTAEGSEKRTCTRCKAAESRSVPKLSHGGSAVVKENVVAATCTAAGSYEDVIYCAGCGIELSRTKRTVSPVGHVDEDMNMTCDVCKAGLCTDHKPTPMKGIAATCTTDGLTEGSRCSKCGEILTAQTVIPAKGHTEVIDKAVAATCTNTGQTQGKHCSVCKAILVERKLLPMKAHTEQIREGVFATCTESGRTQETFCSVCGRVLIAAETIPAKGHSFGAWNVAVQATCTEDGEERRSCAGCGTTESRKLTKLSHAAAKPVKEHMTEATCTSDGSYEDVVYCERCGRELSRTKHTLKATGHSYKDGNCTVCGAADPNYVPPTAKPTPTPVVTATPAPTAKPTPVVTATPAPTAKPTPVVTATPAPTAKPTPVVTATPAPTAKPTPVVTATPAPTTQPTPVVTATPAPTTQPTPVVTATPVPTAQPTPVVTATPAPTTQPTPVVTATPVPTTKPTPTPTPTPEIPMENPFTDVAEDAYYCKPVLWAKAQGITGGTSATTFSPDATCTRGQVVMFLWRSAGSPQPKSTANPFTDVSESDYFYTAVLWAKENGITGGTSATTFGPDAPCTRAHVATFLWRSEGSPEPKNGKNPFTDVGDSDYFRTAVLWAVENQVTSGIGQGLFGPDAPCTRGQIVTFLYKTSLIPEEN